MRRFVSLIGLAAASTISISTFAADFALKTTAFSDGGILPILYTCDSKDISPAISWTNPPAKTQSYVMIMSDSDAPSGTFYHWLAFNIPANEKEIPQDKLPPGSLVGKNSFGKSGYNGPCPPKGAAHTYVFTLYALDKMLNLSTDADEKALEDAMKDRIVGTAKLTAVYSRSAI